MRLLIDTNILLDVLQDRHPHYGASSLLWKFCETGQAEGYISALTFANLIYVMRKELNPEQVEDILNMLSLIFNFVDFSMSEVMRATKMKWNDFEDAVQNATAERIQADYIITRNVRDFLNSKIPAVSPAEYLSQYVGGA